MTFLAAGLLAILFLSCSSSESTRPGQVQTQAQKPRPAVERTALDTGVVAMGDSISISVWGYPEFTAREIVKATGTITIPLIGEQTAAGLTRAEITQSVQRKLAEYVKGDVKLSLEITRAPARITVLGSVTRPGSFASTVDLTLLEVLATVGGWTEQADLRYITVNRGPGGSVEGEVFTVDLQNALDRGLLRTMPIIHAGDVVVVPRSENIVRIFGEFFRDLVIVLGLIGLANQ